MKVESVINERECFIRMSHKDLVVLRNALDKYEPPVREMEDVLEVTLGVLDALSKMKS